MAPPRLGLLIGSGLCLFFAALIYVLAVSGLLFAQPTRPDDIGLYAVTVVLLGFGAGGMILRALKVREDRAKMAF